MKHMDQRTSSLWSLLHGQCNEAVFDVKLKPLGEKCRMVILGLWIRFLASAPEPAARAPQCLGNVSFLPVKLIMALTADERRETGAGGQQRKLAAPLALPPRTQSRPGTTLSKHAAALQISFLKMVNPPFTDYIQSPALPYYWNPIFWLLAIFQELYTYYLNESSWRLYQYWHYFSYSSFYRWRH